jgi:hypothetical protein
MGIGVGIGMGIGTGLGMGLGTGIGMGIGRRRGCPRDTKEGRLKLIGLLVLNILKGGAS